MRHTLKHGPGLYTAVPVGTVPMGTPCTTTEFARGVGICAFGFFFFWEWMHDAMGHTPGNVQKRQRK